MLAQEIGIDLGTANTVVVAKRKGIVAKEPSVVAINRHTKEVIAIGAEARTMIGRTPDTILSIRPVQGGVISDLPHTTALLKHMIRKIAGSRWLRPRVVLTMPTGASAVDRRALAEAATHAGAGEVCLMEEAVAAGLGAGLPVERPLGSLLLDVGSGTVNVAVISLGGVVVSATCNAAGDQMDEAIAKHVKREHNLLIGTPTSERLKLELGAAVPAGTRTVSVVGRQITTGIPASVSVHASEIYSALSDSLAQIDALLLSVLERTPPDLLADITHHGLTLTGGGALLQGLSDRLQKVTGLPVRIAEEPLDAVALGTRRVLEERPRIQLVKVKG